MTKRQTRRSVSISRSSYDQVKAFAAQHNIPAAQVVERAIEAVCDGRLEVRHRVEVPALRLYVASGTSSRPLPPQFPRGATCAICCRDCTGELYQEPLGRDDAMVNVCETCQTVPLSVVAR